jgi:gliding motility-associated-like protein
MKKYIFILINCCIFQVQVGFSQNLIPDEDFEFHFNGFDCPIPSQSLLNSEFWHNVAGTCDLYVKDCVASSIETQAVRQYPGEGNNFLGFWGIFTDAGKMGSEIFGTTLRRPLEGGIPHFFSIDVRYRGKWNSPEEIDHQYYPHYCFSNPAMALQVYLEHDTIQSATKIDFDAAFNINIEPLFTFDKYPFQDTIPSFEWTTLAECFIADGGEAHLGFSMTIDSFTASSPCDSTYQTLDGQISRVYYNVDKIKMIPMPTYITDTLLLCREVGEVSVDMKTYFPNMAVEYLDVEWQDGFQTYIRTLTAPGIYTYRMNYRCGHVIFEFFIKEKKCEVTAFVPNAFTPNFDGRNDELFAYFSADFPISNYEFMVFDRWGNLFYSSAINDGFTGWDGTVNGKNAPIGVYIWALKFKHHAPNETKDYQLSGDVLLVR